MSCRVEFFPSERVVDVPAGTSLLDAARAAMLPVARACGGHGLCGRCGLRVLDRTESLSPEAADEADAKRRNRVAAELRLSCCARVLGDVQVGASYW